MQTESNRSGSGRATVRALGGTGFWAGGGGRPRDWPVEFHSTFLRIESLSHRRRERIRSSMHQGYHRPSMI